MKVQPHGDPLRRFVVGTDSPEFCRHCGHHRDSHWESVECDERSCTHFVEANEEEP